VFATQHPARRVIRWVPFVIAFGFTIALPQSESNAQTIQATQNLMSAAPPLLFLDRQHVAQGRLAPTLDPERVTEAAKADIARMKKDWNIIIELSGHGMQPLKVPYGVRFTPEKAKKTAPWLRTDRPWEQRVVAYQTMIHEEGKYRCWYRTVLTDAARESFFPPGSGNKSVDQVLSYAESADGVHWTKPDLDVYSFNGKPTNVVTPYCRESGVFRDDTAPASERYKCFSFDRLPDSDNEPVKRKYGLYGCVSPDGIHWSRLPDPLLRYFHDTENIAAWDPLLEKYVGYFRGHLDGRAIARSETDDFRNWPPAEVILAAGPQDSAAEDYYTNCFTTYPDDPSLRLLFPAIYHHDTDEVDIRFALSRNNRAWSWMSSEPIIELGAPGEWDSGTIYAAPNLVHLPDGRLALPYAGTASTHNESHPAYYGEDTEAKFELAWATWKDGRLGGLEAKERGEFWSKSLGTFEGSQIEINARTPRHGQVEVALEEPYGRGTKSLPGFTFADCIPFSGDAVWEPLKWKGSSSLEALHGKELILHFRLTTAKLFGVRFIK